jgi:superfamily II DNA/RNA helicase
VPHWADGLQRAVEEQQFNLREGAEIIIATPGRLKDVLERHVLVLSQCRYVVMDEADRMVHLGFEADLTYILDQLPSETMEGEDPSEQMDVDGETVVKKGRTRVTTLFSATMPPPVERLARKYLKRPAIITIGEAGRAVDTVEQRVEFITGEEKKKCVVELSIDQTEQLNLLRLSQTASSRNPRQRAVPSSHHRFCQPEEDGGYGGERSFSCWSASGITR